MLILTTKLNRSFSILIVLTSCACRALAEELKFEKQENEKIAKVINFEMMQSGLALYVRLNSGRVFSLGCGWGLFPEKGIDVSKAQFHIGYLKTMEQPIMKDFRPAEMRDILVLLEDYVRSITHDKNKDEITHLAHLAESWIRSDYKNKEEAAEATNLPSEKLQLFFTVVYLRLLSEKIRLTDK